MKKLDRILNLAQSQTGYTEKDNDKDLDSMVGSTAGSGNHTKYARDITAAGLTGYCGSAWCAVYQFWLDMQTVGKDQALEHFGPQFYNCFAIRDYAKSKNRWLPATAEPKPGYRVIFKQSHIALVIKVSANKIYTNEGNTSNGTAVVRNGGMVCNKSYNRSNSSILGYVAVEYLEEYNEGFQRASDGVRWWYQYSDGTYARSGWKWLMEATGGTSGWYLFDDNGYMLTGYQRDTAGEIFLLCPEAGRDEGKCMITDERGALKVARDYDFENHKFII